MEILVIRSYPILRDLTAGHWSNDLSTPMIAGQDRGYHEQYGPDIVNRVNFGNFRPHPLGSLNASLGVLLNKSDNSGTAIGLTRSVAARLQFSF